MQVATLQRAMLENIYREMCNAANMTLTLPLTLTLALTLTFALTLAPPLLRDPIPNVAPSSLTLP